MCFCEGGKMQCSSCDKIEKIRKFSMELEIKQPSKTTLKKFLEKIADGEKLEIDKGVIKEIINKLHLMFLGQSNKQNQNQFTNQNFMIPKMADSICLVQNQKYQKKTKNQNLLNPGLSIIYLIYYFNFFLKITPAWYEGTGTPGYILG